MRGRSWIASIEVSHNCWECVVLVYDTRIQSIGFVFLFRLLFVSSDIWSSRTIERMGALNIAA